MPLYKPVDPNAILRDPLTRVRLPPEGDERDGVHWTRRWLAGETFRLEGKEWVRRVPGLADVEQALEHKGHAADERAALERRRDELKQLERHPYVAPASEAKPAPTGREPVTPLTTREGK